MRKIIILTLFSLFLVFSGSMAIAINFEKPKEEDKSEMSAPQDEFQSEADKIKKGKEAIKNFSNKNEDELKYLKTNKYPHGNVMQFKSTNKSELYFVNEEGKVLGVEYLGLPQKGDIIINDADAVNKAKKFAKDKYENFDLKNMKLIKQGLLNKGSSSTYWYWWREEINGLLTPNYVSIRVNPYNGEVCSFRCLNISLPDIQSPRISRESAINTVKEKYKDIKNINAELDMWFKEDGDLLERWTVKVELPEREDGTTNSKIIEIDAQTGKVINVLAS